jgi:hypothetical protein
MLHLYNSCYAYPYAIFDPSSADYIVVGDKHNILGVGVENSFYYNNVSIKQCFERFATYEDFIESNLVEPVCSNKEKFIIYCDDDTMIKFFTAKIKSHIFNFDEVLFLDLAKLFGVRLKIKSKLIDSSNKQIISDLGDKFIGLTQSSSVNKFPMSQYWTWENAGIEWKVANRNCGVSNNHIEILNDLVNRYVYSFFDEAKECYFSRKTDGWAADINNQEFRKIVSMKELYMEMRKELALFTDPLILQFFETGVTEELLNDPKFLLLLSSDKIDTWLFKWLMKLPQSKITELGLIA